MNEARRAPQVTVREAQAKLAETATEPSASGQAEEQADHQSSGAALIDVREAWEYTEGHAPGAVLIPLSEFTSRFQEVPRDREALVICHSGYRSMQATIFLRQQGYTQVANVMGGMEEWEAAGLPVERGAAQR